jgi:hypothetical protein
MAALAGNLLTKGLVEQRNFRAAPLQSWGIIELESRLVATT